MTLLKKFLKLTPARLLITTAFLTHSLGAFGAVEKWVVKKDAEATFEAISNPGFMTITGTGAPLVGEAVIDGSSISGTFTAELDKLNTRRDMRDRHMKEKYLQTDKFKTATLEIKSVALPKDFKPGTDVKEAPFEGVFTLKNVPKPVKGKVSITGEAMKTVAEFKISLTEYPVGVPSFLGATVAEEVTVKASIPGFERK